MRIEGINEQKPSKLNDFKLNKRILAFEWTKLWFLEIKTFSPLMTRKGFVDRIDRWHPSRSITPRFLQRDTVLLGEVDLVLGAKDGEIKLDFTNRHLIWPQGRFPHRAPQALPPRRARMPEAPFLKQKAVLAMGWAWGTLHSQGFNGWNFSRHQGTGIRSRWNASPFTTPSKTTSKRLTQLRWGYRVTTVQRFEISFHLLVLKLFAMA